MLSHKQSGLFTVCGFLSLFALSACQSPDDNSTAGTCEGTTVTDDQRYIKSKVTVPLGNGNSGYFDIHVQRLQKSDTYTWTETPVTSFDDGKTPCQAMTDIKTMWKSFYQDMVDAGIHPDVIEHYVSSISSYYGDTNRANAGVYAETHFGVCGYAGAPGTIRCGLGSDDGFKHYYLSHENTHGFQWDWTSGNDEAILMYRIFAHYANALYQQSITDDSVFIEADGAWHIDLMDYTMQNEAEWFAEIFKGYLYPNTGHWPFMQANHPELVSFFDCIWKQGKSFTQCQSDNNVPMVAFANSVPVVNIPSASSFSTADSEAIWNVCFNSTNKSNYTTAFDQVIDSLTPGQYSDSSDKFKLGYGDCDHNGVIDWICSYQGPAPDGGNYLWNGSNQTGTYTFIASGDSNTSYAEYKQDPYLTLPSINGYLAQPMFREWQGDYGSCNGARYFNHVPDRFPDFASQVSNLPAEYNGKESW